MGGFRGDSEGVSGKIQMLYKADDRSSLLCFISPQVLWLPFQHKQNTSPLTLNSHDYDHLFHK